MTSPFRDETFRCPACPESGLRTFATRLICDACQGMFVTRDDLVTQIGDLAGVVPELEFFKDKASERGCPRCTQAMIESRLRIRFPVIEEDPKTPPRLDRCDAHGIWFDTDELAAVFEVVSRVAGRRGGSGGGDAGGGGFGGTRVPGNGFGWGL